MDQFSTLLIENLFYVSLYTIGYLVVFTVRGFFEALVSLLFGDKTGKDEGFLTLNPAAHCNPVGLVFLFGSLLIASFILSPRASQLTYIALLIMLNMQRFYEVPVNPMYFKRLRLGLVSTTLAGSIGCFLLVLLMMYGFVYLPWTMIGSTSRMVQELLAVIIELALWVGVIRLIPIAPFRGWDVVKVFLPVHAQDTVVFLEQHSFYILMFCFVVPGTSDLFLGMINIVTSYIVYGLRFLVF